jgi:hypothetical protein
MPGTTLVIQVVLTHGVLAETILVLALEVEVVIRHAACKYSPLLTPSVY